MTTRRTLAALASTTGAAGILAACGASSGPDTGNRPAQITGPKEISYAGWSSNLANPGGRPLR